MTPNAFCAPSAAHASEHPACNGQVWDKGSRLPPLKCPGSDTYIHNAQKRKEYACVVDQGMEAHGIGALRDRVLELRDSVSRAREAAGLKLN